MSLTNHVPTRNRVYVRRFDHEEAAARYAAGATIKDLAAEYAVTRTAIRNAVVPGQKDRGVEYGREWRTGECETCGCPAMRLVSGKAEHNPDGRVLCHKCRSVERRERLRYDDEGNLVAVRCNTVDCANGERWQSPDSFPRGVRFRDVRPGGIHTQCRSCLTRARQRYRDAHKVPCSGCGAPSLPPNEKRTRGHDKPRCRKCFYADQRRAFGLEAPQSTKGTRPSVA